MLYFGNWAGDSLTSDLLLFLKEAKRVFSAGIVIIWRWLGDWLNGRLNTIDVGLGQLDLEIR